jgi:hypothetical protein
MDRLDTGLALQVPWCGPDAGTELHRIKLVATCLQRTARNALGVAGSAQFSTSSAW